MQDSQQTVQVKTWALFSTPSNKDKGKTKLVNMNSQRIKILIEVKCSKKVLNVTSKTQINLYKTYSNHSMYYADLRYSNSATEKAMGIKPSIPPKESEQ